jgi:hypothetical protein
MSQDISLTVDYHDRACVIRRYDDATRREQLFTEVLTTREELLRIVNEARRGWVAAALSTGSRRAPRDGTA